MLPLLLLLPALRAAPVPERPARADSARLVEPGSLELQLGSRWSEASGTSLPAQLAYAFGSAVEARFALDMAQVDGGEPGFWLGAKVSLAQEPRFGLALLPATALPARSGDPWSGRLGLLGTLELRELRLDLDTGPSFEARDGRPAYADWPVSLCASSTGNFSVFGELGFRLGGGLHDALYGAGARLLLTDLLLLDAEAAWSQALTAPVFQLGFTASLGRLGS